ncbi:MAG: hypothetical protein II699_07960 [Lachnospiraceae bacterium]|nr:hypothetical protein [Lachnospiraceae bacterium]
MKENEFLNGSFEGDEVFDEINQHQEDELNNNERTYTEVDMGDGFRNNERKFTEVDMGFEDGDARENKINDILIKYNAIGEDIKPEEIRPLNVNIVSSTINQLNAVNDNYPEFADRIEELFLKAGAMFAAASSDKANTKSKLPADGTMTVTTRKLETIKEWAELLVDVDILIDDISEKYPVDTPSGALLDVIKKNMRVMTDPDFVDNMALDPRYEPYIRTNFLTIPVNKFKTDKVNEKNEPVFEKNDKKYEELSKKMPFIKMAEERVNFMQKKFIPFHMYRRSVNYGKKDYINYVIDYKKHLEEQSRYVDELRKISPDDELIKDNYVFVTNTVNTGFVENWQTTRYGDIIKKDNKAQYDMLDRGWPVDDIGLLTDLKGYVDKAEDYANSQDATAQEKKIAREIMDSLREQLELVKVTYVPSPEVREELLKGFKAPIDKYVELSKSLSKFETITIGKRLDDAINREVKDFEIGNNPMTINKVGDYEEPVAFSSGDIRDNIDIMYRDLKAVELSYKGSNQFKEMKEHLKALKDYAHRLMDQPMTDEEGLTPNQVRMKRLSELRGRISLVIDATDQYLEHKKRDFERDADRRDSAKKQKHEQPRIKMSLKLRDKLMMMSDRIDEYERYLNPDNQYIKDVEKHIGEARDRAWDKIYAISDAIAKDTKNEMTEGNYRRNISKMIVYYVQSTDNYYERHNDTDAAYKERIEAVGGELTDKQIKSMMSGSMRDAIDKEVEKYMAYKNGKSADYQKVSYNSIANLYKSVIKGEVQARKAAETVSDKRHKATAGYKENLVSKKKPEQAAGPKK